MTYSLQPLTPESTPVEQPARLLSLDAYRGFIKLVMASGGFGFAKVAQKLGESAGGNGLWGALAYQFDHVKWAGCGFWDLIQPSFMFMVGVALPYSYASRVAKGQSPARIVGHAVIRAFILVLLGIFLSSNWSTQTNFTFMNVLTQIGLGYCFLYLVLGRGPAVQLLTACAILVGHWYLFYQHPLPGSDFDYSPVGMPDDVESFSGIAAHWNKHTNFGAAVDQWFLNLFPRPEPFRFNKEGYVTINFVSSIATMIFGVMAGELLKSDRAPGSKRNRLFIAGIVCLLAGMAVDHTIWPERLIGAADEIIWKVKGPIIPGGETTATSYPTTPDVDPASLTIDPNWSLCPIVKRIWTPSWAVFSTGWTLWMLAAFYWLIDIEGYRLWAYPFTVVGVNSIAMYCMSQLLRPWIRATLKIHFGQNLFDCTYGPILDSVAILAVLWLVCLWMYRKKVFLRI